MNLRSVSVAWDVLYCIFGVDLIIFSGLFDIWERLQPNHTQILDDVEYRAQLGRMISAFYQQKFWKVSCRILFSANRNISHEAEVVSIIFFCKYEMNLLMINLRKFDREQLLPETIYRIVTDHADNLESLNESLRKRLRVCLVLLYQ